MNRPQPRGFILLFGTRNLISKGDGQVVAACPRCKANALVEQTARPWFTIFFIPVFPVGATRKILRCSSCQASFNIAPKQMAEQAARIDAKQNERAIAMYNSLRASPANSITLNDLMQLYAAMGEFDQAISAAGEFSAALNNSEQCMVTLGRIYLAKDDRATALQWLNAATDRNPSLGEAHYFKAATFMTAQPPQLDQAITAARAARGAGYPNSENLVRELEAKARGNDGALVPSPGTPGEG